MLAVKVARGVVDRGEKVGQNRGLRRGRAHARETVFHDDHDGGEFLDRLARYWDRFGMRLYHGITGMTPRPRQDKGQVRKVTPEELLKALNAAKPHFHHQRTNKRALYRFCIEKGLLHPDRIAQSTIGRTLHTYTNTVKILFDACRVEFESSAFQCERRLIAQAFSLNHAGKSLTTILDDAHLMDLANLGKLRLLFEDFPKNLDYDFRAAVALPPRWLKHYQAQATKKKTPPPPNQT